jgi:hypothetical protein
MKRLSFVSLFLLLFTAVFVSCADPSLNDYIEGLKGSVPEDMGGGLTMTDVSIVDDYVQIDVTSDETELDLGNPMVGMILPSVAEALKAEYLEGDMKDFMQLCSDEGKGFRMMLTGAKSGNTATMFEVTPEELNTKFPPRTKE